MYLMRGSLLLLRAGLSLLELLVALYPVPHNSSSINSLTAVLGPLDMLPAGLCQRVQAGLLHNRRVLLTICDSVPAVS